MKYSGENERVYEGDWRDDKRNGRGVVKRPDGYQFEGDFLDDKAHGKIYEWGLIRRKGI